MDPLPGVSWLLIPYRELHLRLGRGAMGISGRNVLLATGGKLLCVSLSKIGQPGGRGPLIGRGTNH
jgi:hypothetical protein